MDLESLEKFVYKPDLMADDTAGDGKMYACPMCPSTFTVKYNLERHVRTHTGERPYECQCCSMSFFRLDKLTAHERTAHATEILSFKCNECSEVFSSRLQLRLHRKAHDGAHECEICGKVFTMRKVLVRHKTVHAVEKSFICPTCGKAFGTRSALRLHNRKHTGEKPYKCQICDKEFAQKAQLNSHNKRIHTDNNKVHECAICDLQFPTTFDLIKHRRIHVGDKNYECEICAKTFQSKTRLDAHKRLHTGEKPYVCEVCGKKFGAARYLRVHNSLHYDKKNHGNTATVPDSPSGPQISDIVYIDGTYWECPICQVRFKQAFRLKRHLVVHSGEKNPYKRKLHSENDINAHEMDFGESSEDCKPIESVHLISPGGIEIPYDPQVISEQVLHECNLCGQVFQKLGRLNLHKKLHGTDNQYPCDICNEVFLEESDLKMHRMSHSALESQSHDNTGSEISNEGSEDASYQICQKIGGEERLVDISYECVEQIPENGMNESKKRAMGEKCYPCATCGKAFTTSARLKVHNRVHNGEKPFKCKICDKAFSEKRYLSIHNRTHTGEKPYSCEYCPRRFADMSARNSHRKLHTGERPYECSQCDKRFLKSSNLKNHLATHSELKHMCDMCGVMFATKLNLLEHKKIHSVSNES